MSKELAESIVLAAQTMEHNEGQVISVIYRRYVGICNRPARNFQGNIFEIFQPEPKTFDSFEQAYNFLIRKGYKAAASENKNLTTLLNTIIESNLKNSNNPNEPAVVLMMFQKIDVESWTHKKKDETQIAEQHI